MDRNNEITNTDSFKQIAETIAKINDAEKIECFLNELFTQSEIADIIQRWNILKLLADKTSQRDIASKLAVSLCKITRGAKILKNDSSIIREILFDESWRN